VSLILDGVRQPYSQEVDFTPTDPLVLSVAPSAPGQLQVQIANPAVTAFAGRLSLGSLSRPVHFGLGQKNLMLTLPSASGKTPVCLLRDTRGSLVARLLVPHFVPLEAPLISLRAVLDGDAKVPSAVHLTPESLALRVDYRFAHGWSFVRVFAPPPMPLIGRPVGVGMWVYGDGSGNAARMRFRDATGQTLQANGMPIDWRGWRFVSFRLAPAPGAASDLGHWGGANDGLAHYPVQVDTLFLFDSLAEAPRHEGTIWLKSPVVIYAAGP
jgi:hypothetical protein